MGAGYFAPAGAREVGLPFRRYMLWRKLTRSMLAIGRERTLAAAFKAGYLVGSLSIADGLRASVLLS